MNKDKCREAFEGEMGIEMFKYDWDENSQSYISLKTKEKSQRMMAALHDWRLAWNAALSQPDPVREQLVIALKEALLFLPDLKAMPNGKLPAIGLVVKGVHDALAAAGASVEGE